MHAATRGGAFEGKRWREYPWNLAQFHLVVSHEQECRKRIPPRARQLIEKVIAQWRQEQGQFRSLRKGIIHGDFFDDNILSDGKSVKGVVDFGDAVESWYAADVAIALLELVFTRRDSALRMRCFLRGYEQVFPLPEVEKAALVLFMKMRAVTAIVEIYHDSKESVWPDRIQKMSDVLGFLERS